MGDTGAKIGGGIISFGITCADVRLSFNLDLGFNLERDLTRVRGSARDEFVLERITTTIYLHKKILRHEKFINSDFDTNWLSKEKFF